MTVRIPTERIDEWAHIAASLYKTEMTMAVVASFGVLPPEGVDHDYQLHALHWEMLAYWLSRLTSDDPASPPPEREVLERWRVMALDRVQYFMNAVNNARRLGLAIPPEAELTAGVASGNLQALADWLGEVIGDV